MSVADLRHHNPLSDAFLDAGVQAGHARNDDFNGATQDGVGFYQTTINRARRWSSARAYLGAASDFVQGMSAHSGGTEIQPAPSCTSVSLV